MKKNVFIVVNVLLFLLSLYTVPVFADSGYYYESIDVLVEVNNKREFTITETLNVYYEEEMHGIIRTLPEQSDVEGYVIKDIHVEGAPYQLENAYNGIDVRIGDANQTVQGLQQYVLTYTLCHYQDYDQNHDYLYLNLIGDDFDTYTKKLTAKIVWPEDFVVESVTLTDGYYGSTSNQKLRYTLIENGVEITSIATIEEYEAATVQISYPEGTFSEAPVYVFPYIVNQKNIEIEFDEVQDIHIKQSITLTLQEDSIFYSTHSLFYSFYDTRIKVEDFTGWIDGHMVMDDMNYVNLEGQGMHTIEMEYTLHPNVLLNTECYLTLVSADDDTQVEQFTLSLKMPKDPVYSIRFGRYNDIQETQRYTEVVENHVLKVQTLNTMQAAEEFVLHLNVNKADFYRPTPLWVFAIPVVGILLFAFVFILRLVHHQVMVSPVSFYPPEGMNSAEAGYLIDEKISDVDMTSLIFYWASLGCLKIHKKDKNEFFLEKITDIPSSRPYYEQNLFNDMFGYGIDQYVFMDNLKEKFYVDIEDAKRMIVNQYKKNTPIYETGDKWIRVVITILSLLLMMGSFMLVAFQSYGSMAFSIFMPFLVTLTIMALVASMTEISVLKYIVWGLSVILMLYFVIALDLSFTPFIVVLVIMTLLVLMTKVTILKYIIVGIFFAAMLYFIFLIDLYELPLLVVWACCLLAILLVFCMKRYTPDALDIIGELRGFKDFLLHAEKDQLEALIEENPEYYYDILPFAQALHVTKVWEDKFKDIVVRPPSYYEGDFMNYQTFNHFTNDVQQAMRDSMSAPRSTGSGDSSYDGGSSSDGGYSGGGGGFSDGGSSGGGSGGGGSRGW